MLPGILLQRKKQRKNNYLTDLIARAGSRAIISYNIRLSEKKTRIRKMEDFVLNPMTGKWSALSIYWHHNRSGKCHTIFRGHFAAFSIQNVRNPSIRMFYKISTFFLRHISLVEKKIRSSNKKFILPKLIRIILGGSI